VKRRGFIKASRSGRLSADPMLSAADSCGFIEAARIAKRRGFIEAGRLGTSHLIGYGLSAAFCHDFIEVSWPAAVDHAAAFANF